MLMATMTKARLCCKNLWRKVVMGAPDWDSTLQRPRDSPGGVPKRDIPSGRGRKITLGDTTVHAVATPGHTPGPCPSSFPCRTPDRTLTVAYPGDTAFNFPRTRRGSRLPRQPRKLAELAAAAGATVLMTNHTEFDPAYDRARIAQLPRARREASARDRDATVQRYFEMTANCAEAQRVSLR